MGNLRVGYGALLLSLAVACGGEDKSDSSPPTGGSAGQASGGASAGAPAGGAPAAGAGGSASAGSPSAGAGPVPCNGTWPAATSLIPPEVGIIIFSPALSPDGLELIYARNENAIVGFQRSRRASTADAFPKGTPLTELDSVCMPSDWRSADISADGLRIYVECYSIAGEQIGLATLHVATRASLTAPFVYAEGSQMVGPGGSISSDELTFFTSSDMEPGSYPPLQYARTDKSQPFGTGTPIPGIEALNFSAPDISSDGLTLYAGLNGDVVSATRENITAPFGAPVTVFAASTTDTTEALGAPELSRDCRSLIYLRQVSDAATSSTTSELMISRR